MLGTRYPILQGALASYGRKFAGPKFVAAVCNAGCLGMLPTWGRTEKELRDDIRKTKKVSKGSFGVNLVPLNREFVEERVRIIIEEGITIVTTGRGDPRIEVVSRLKREGIMVIPVVPNVRLARRVEMEGADAVVASGAEAGGHVGEIGTLPLIPQVVDAVHIPVIAAGGIADGRGIAAAFALGACGVQLGTRFMATKEAGISKSAMELILQAGEEDTFITTALTGKPVRIVVSERARSVIGGLRKVLKEKGESKAILEIRKMAKDYRCQQVIPGGQAVGLVHSIPSVAELVLQLVSEVKEVSGKMRALECFKEAI